MDRPKIRSGCNTREGGVPLPPPTNLSENKLKQIIHTVADENITINVTETADDLEDFMRFIERSGKLAVDSETTGLDIYSNTFKLRVVQFGTPTEAWIVPVERGQAFQETVKFALRTVNDIIIQNASYDLQVFDRHLGVRMEEMWDRVTDTKILAHLVDPRGKEEGGVGTSLEDLTREYIDAAVADGVKTSITDMAKAAKVTKAQVFASIDYDDPTYQLYAGMDTILAARLLGILTRKVPTVSNKLIRYEHKLAEVCSMMERTGFLLDVDYTSRLSEKLHDNEIEYTNQAGRMGCENVNSTEQVADVLESRGVKITQKTPTGRRKVDKTLLERLADQGDEFAHAVIEAKKARKWRTTWVDGFLKQMDSSGRCHPAINPLRARTARMSITGIPAQTLPAGDWLIRKCFVADQGQRIGSIDFQAQELRVLAALSGDTTMQRAFVNGDDLHQITADASGVDRKIGKMTNFLTVYGGGARNLAQQADIDLTLAKKVIAGFDKAYPKVKPYAKRLQRDAQLRGEITTPVGRVLPVDKDRPYAALNYMVQSTARDITCAGLIRLHQHGMTPYLRLPIHDEILVSVPEAKAAGAVKKIADIMSTNFNGVFMATDAEVGDRSWGSLYEKKG